MHRLPGVVGVHNGPPVVTGRRTITSRVVIWCTGLRPDYSWLHLAAQDEMTVPAGHPGLDGNFTTAAW